jgi:hypothetical protein
VSKTTLSPAAYAVFMDDTLRIPGLDVQALRLPGAVADEPFIFGLQFPWRQRIPRLFRLSSPW